MREGRIQIHSKRFTYVLMMAQHLMLTLKHHDFLVFPDYIVKKPYIFVNFKVGLDS